MPLGNILEQDVDANAKSLKFVGSNIIASDDVIIRYKGMQVTADKAIVNLSTKDIEAVGNIVFTQRTYSSKKIEVDELDFYQKDPNTRIIIEGYETSATGRQYLRVRLIQDEALFKASRAVGNLNSGVIEFSNFACMNGEYFCTGKSATRAPNGQITIRNVKLTTCEYILDDHEHYSITANKAVITPPGKDNKPISHYLSPFNSDDKVTENKPQKSNLANDIGDHSIWVYGAQVRIGGVPVCWLPFMYKPRDENWNFLQIRAGDSSDWGYFVQLSKKFQVFDDPNTTAKLMLDYYSKRGVGYGTEIDMNTEKSKTSLFAYGIWDNAPYGTTSENYEENTQRIKINNWRYDISLSHLNHITPRMDFRGHFEALSDYNVVKDYFEDVYDDNPQPVTFASLEYQFDRLSAALYIRPRVNNFFSTVTRLPEFRLDIPRQELFKNIYYQGETSIDNFEMLWRKYDRDRPGNPVDPHNYKAVRFDTLHMFYYPFKLDWLNVVPRAGFRATYYSATSKRKIRTEDLGIMYAVDDLDGAGVPNLDVENYDRKGGAKLRFAMELGIQANTKIYRSWQNVKNAFWELDGLRHVMVPYINYNFIPTPTVDRSHIYYFDDIDRIDRQNFVRIGLKNRLQTRRGDYGKEEIYNWATMENYMDFHMEKQEGFKRIGEMGTIITFNPIPELTFSSELLLDIGSSNDHDIQAIRGDGYRAGRPGISSKYINKWLTSVSYEIMEDWRVHLSYDYQDAYKQRSIYSMGSSLTDINSGTAFSRYYGRQQVISGGMDFPIPIDDKTFGSFNLEYDFERGFMRKKSLKIMRKLHCWEAALEVSQEIKRNSKSKKEYNNSVMFTLALVAIPSVKISQRSGSGDSDD
jgi:lipopolysaccharide assembly outer membrane protein LptD (OstA)